jgi:hypothetical protein
MIKSDCIAQLAKALASAQAEITNPQKNREVTVSTKTGGSYKFKYATLDGILDAVRPALTKNGLWFVQTLANGDGKYRLETTLMHESGEWVQSEQPLFVSDATNQAFGSALTYAKRYALTGMLGIAADEDDDGNGADGNHIRESTDRKAAPKPTGSAPANAKAKAANGAGVDSTVAWATEKNKAIAAAKTFEDLAAIDAAVRNNADLAEPTRAHLLANLDKMQKHLAGANKQAAE